MLMLQAWALYPCGSCKLFHLLSPGIIHNSIITALHHTFVCSHLSQFSCGDITLHYMPHKSDFIIYRNKSVSSNFGYKKPLNISTLTSLSSLTFFLPLIVSVQKLIDSNFKILKIQWNKISSCSNLKGWIQMPKNVGLFFSNVVLNQ